MNNACKNKISEKSLEDCVDDKRKSMQKSLDDPKVITCGDFEKAL